MLEARSANLMELAAVLPRAAERIDNITSLLQSALPMSALWAASG